MFVCVLEEENYNNAMGVFFACYVCTYSVFFVYLANSFEFFNSFKTFFKNPIFSK